jgi:hypothetical protein
MFCPLAEQSFSQSGPGSKTADEAPTSGSVDGQGSVEDVATLNKDRPSNSVSSSEEEYLASIMDGLFDPDQTDEALISLPAPEQCPDYPRQLSRRQYLRDSATSGPGAL